MMVVTEGCRVLVALLVKRRRDATSRGRTPLTAIWATSSTLVVNVAAATSAAYDCIRILANDTWYRFYGQFVFQQLVAFFFLLSNLSVTHYYFLQVREAGLIRQRTLTFMGALCICLQIAVPAFSICSWLIDEQRNSLQLIESWLFVLIGGASLLTLVLVAILVLLWTNRVTLKFPSNSQVVTSIRQRTSKIVLFTQKFTVWAVILLVSDLGWKWCDKNYYLVPAIWANAMLFFMAFSIFKISSTTYHFLLPRGEPRLGQRSWCWEHYALLWRRRSPRVFPLAEVPGEEVAGNAIRNNDNMNNNDVGPGLLDGMISSSAGFPSVSQLAYRTKKDKVLLTHHQKKKKGGTAGSTLHRPPFEHQPQAGINVGAQYFTSGYFTTENC